MTVTAHGVKLKANGATVTLLDMFFPVGSAYLTYENKNPSSFLGGTWALYATDRYLRGGSASSKAGATGGSDTISVSQMPAHSHLYVSTGKFCWNVSGVASAPAWGDGDAKTGTTTGTTGGGHRSTHRTQPCSFGGARRRGGAPCGLKSSARAITAPCPSAASTSTSPTSTRLASGRGRFGRASLRAPSSCRAEARRPAITPSARPEAQPPSRCRQTLCRKSICNRSSATIAAEQTLGALRANTVGSIGKISTFGSPEGTSRMRTGPRTFPSICGGAPRSLREEA